MKKTLLRDDIGAELRASAQAFRVKECVQVRRITQLYFYHLAGRLIST